MVARTWSEMRQGGAAAIFGYCVLLHGVDIYIEREGPLPGSMPRPSNEDSKPSFVEGWKLQGVLVPFDVDLILYYVVGGNHVALARGVDCTVNPPP